MKTAVRGLLAVAAMVTMMVGLAPVAASAEPLPYTLCTSSNGTSPYGCLYFYVTWGNRTAKVTGAVSYSWNRPGKVTATWGSYVGSTQTDSQNRSADGTVAERGFNFNLGNANVRGDITQIVVILCDTYNGCTQAYSLFRP